MKYAVDLHIHSALSPCADNEMTPNNIVNMAMLKGLDIIAVTDHNSCGNVEAVMKCAEGTKLLVIPGMEVETLEEIHLVCYFPGISQAMEFQDEVYGTLPHTKLREDIFGEQLLMDEKDNVIGKVENLLSIASGLSVEQVVEKVRFLSGAVVPAHVDREHNSMLATFGFIPDEMKFKFLELSRKSYLENLEQFEKQLKGYSLICSSDAHYLGHILERESYVNLPDKNIKSIIDLFV